MNNKDTNAIAERYQSMLLQEEYRDCYKDCIEVEGKTEAECRKQCSHMIEDDSNSNVVIDIDGENVNPHGLNVAEIKSFLNDADKAEGRGGMFANYVMPYVTAYIDGEVDCVDCQYHMDTEGPQVAELEKYLDTIKYGRVGNLARKVGSAVSKGTRNLGRKVKSLKPQFQSPVKLPNLKIRR